MTPAPVRVELPGITLSVADTGGAGPAVLLLHGWPDRASLWHHQIDALAADGYRVVAPDLRGFGDSDRPLDVEAYRMRTLGADVLNLADALGIGEFALAGHDWGASLGWALAMTSPRVTRYAAFSVGHPASFLRAGLTQKAKSWYMLWFQFPGVAEQVLPADDWAFFRTWAHPGTAPDDELVTRQIADLARPDALTASLNWYRANIDPATFVGAPPPELPRLTIPVTGVWSAGDMALTEQQMTDSQQWLDRPFSFERVDGAGHWIPHDAPDRTTDILRAFLRAAH